MDKELVYKIFNSQNSITEWPKKKKKNQNTFQEDL